MAAFLNDFFDLSDRILAPRVEILGVRPIYIRQKEADGFISRGFGAILHVKSGNRDVSITDARIAGRLNLTLNEWLGYEARDGMPMEELVESMRRRKPYFRISLAGTFVDSKGTVRLEPFETAYVKILFIQPISFTRGMSTHRDYLGFAEEKVSPKLTKLRLEVHAFLRRKGSAPILTDIPSEMTSGLLKVELTAGGSLVNAPVQTFQKIKAVSTKEWDDTEAPRLYNEEDEIHEVNVPW